MFEEALTTPEHEPEGGSDEPHDDGFPSDKGLDVLEASANAATAGLTTAEILAAKMNLAGLNFQKAQEAAEAFAETLRWVNEVPVSVELMRTVDEGVVTFGELARDLEDEE